MLNRIKLSDQNKILALSFFAFLVLYFFISKKTAETPAKPQEDKSFSADTYIPAGQVLVPIQIDNSSALSGLVGSFAVVDLYAEQEKGGNQLVASKVKLIRAPLNAEQFAVLVSDAKAKEIMQIKTSFWVVLQNRESLRANLEKNTLEDPESKMKNKLPFGENRGNAAANVGGLTPNSVHSSKSDYSPQLENPEQKVHLGPKSVSIEYQEKKKL